MMGQATGCSRLQAPGTVLRYSEESAYLLWIYLQEYNGVDSLGAAPSSGMQSTRILTTTSMSILRVLWVILAKSGTVLRDPEHASVHRLQRRVRREPHVLEPREDDAPEAHAR